MGNQQQYEEEVDLIEYIKVIYKYRLMIIAFILVSMVFAGISSFRQPPKYQASATFFPLNINTQVGVNSDINSNAVSKMVISVLECRTMADRIIDQLDLKTMWGHKLVVDTRQTLACISKVTVERNGLIKLTVTLGDPNLAAKIANAYVDNLEYLNKEFGLGAQREIVQVIDRANVPERPMSRRIGRSVLLGGIASFMFSTFFAFFLEFIQKNNIIKRLKEK